MIALPAAGELSFLLLLYPRELVWLGYALVQDGSASAADQILQAVAEHAVLFEGHQCVTMLPAHTDIFTAAALALCHRKVLFSISFFPLPMQISKLLSLPRVQPFPRGTRL